MLNIIAFISCTLATMLNWNDNWLAVGVCGTLAIANLLCALGLAACKEEGDRVFSSKYVDLEIVEDCGTEGKVLVDKDTGVLYLWYRDWDKYGQTLTPLYNADGTLKNIADFE